MKLLPFILSLLVLSVGAFATDVSKILSDAQTALMRGDLETAKRNFQIVYQLDPHNAVAIGGLKQVAVQLAKEGDTGKAEKELAKVILPQIQFREATFGEALEFMKKKVTEVSGGKQAANFVVQSGVDQAAKITLSLTNIPVPEALRYIAELVNAKVEYQKYAIVIRPAGGVSSNSPTTPPQPQ